MEWARESARGNISVFRVSSITFLGRKIQILGPKGLMGLMIQRGGGGDDIIETLRAAM